jgi:hypothetical protein
MAENEFQAKYFRASLLKKAKQRERESSVLLSYSSRTNFKMGTAKKTRKFGAVRNPLSASFKASPHSQNHVLTPPQVKRIIGQNDARLKKNQNKGEIEGKKAEKGTDVVREVYVPFPHSASPTCSSIIH